MVSTTLRGLCTFGIAAIITAAAPPGAAARASMVTVGAGGDLQAAIDGAQPGDTILLEAGATFVGNFVLRAKGGGDYITIRSSAPDAVLPGSTARIGPGYAAYLPKLRSPNSQPAMATAAGAHHYRLQFLELQANAGGAGNILSLGDGSPVQNTMHLVPHHLIVDRVYIHGDAEAGQKRGIALNSASTSVLGSYISEIKAAGQDSQAICGWNGPGPYLIANNYLEAAGENVMFGGADPSIPGLVPSDITFVGNHLAKPFAWRGQRWTVKNLLELKNAQRVVIDGNVMENNWQAAQAGYAILFKSVNQDGSAPWSIVQDVRFTNNIVRHVSSAINILGRDASRPSLEADTITIRNNLFEDVSGARYGGSGRFLLINGGAHITIDHNTVLNDGSSTIFADGRPTTGFVFTNNIVPDNGWAIKGSGTSAGNGTLAHYFPGAMVLGGVFAGSSPATYPAANFYPAAMSGVGFVDLAGGNYRLAPTSIYRGGATDGADVGCNIDALPGGTGASSPPRTPGQTPGAPENVRATAIGSTVSIAWSPSVQGGAPTSYILEAGTTPGATDAARFNTGNAGTSFVTSGVPPGLYYLAIRAINTGGESARSDGTVVVVGQGAGGCTVAPRAPTGLRAETSGLNVVLSWIPPGGGCAPMRYILLVGSSPGGRDLLQAPLGTEAGLHASGPPGRYYVRVVSQNGYGFSAASNEIVVTLAP